MCIKSRFFSLCLLVLAGVLPSAADAMDAPYVSVMNNAPGLNTVYWAHAPPEGYIVTYLVKRSSPAGAWSYHASTGSHSDTGLQPNSDYAYAVCAIDFNAAERCSPWVFVRTMAAPVASGGERPPPSFTNYIPHAYKLEVFWESPIKYDFFQVRLGSGRQFSELPGGTRGSLLITGLGPDDTHHIVVQGCFSGLFGSACSKWSPVLVAKTLDVPRPPVPPEPEPVDLKGAVLESPTDVGDAEMPPLPGHKDAIYTTPGQALGADDSGHRPWQ